MLRLIRKYELEFYARQLTPGMNGVIWFRGPYDEIVQYDMNRGEGSTVATASEASSISLSAERAIYGTWDGEIWTIDLRTFKARRLFRSAEITPVLKIVQHESELVFFCLTKHEILGFDLEGRITARIQFRFAIDIVCQGSQIWILDSEKQIHRWTFATGEKVSSGTVSEHLLLANAMGGLVAGLGQDLALFDSNGTVVDRIAGNANSISWDSEFCIIGKPDQDHSINLTRLLVRIQQLTCYNVSNCHSMTQIAAFGFVVSHASNLLVFSKGEPKRQNSATHLS